MIFKSRISLFFELIAAVAIIFLLALVRYTAYSSNDRISFIFACTIATLVIILLLSLLFNTKYIIQDIFLTYRSGPFYGQIRIEDIKELRLNTTRFVGLKMALAGKGIIVRYNKWDEIYISPEKEKLFVETLLKINPNITIIPPKSPHA